MNVETIVFYLFAALTVFAGLRVITARNPMHAVLFLVLAFVSSSGIWMLLEAEFLAITLVLVYVGGEGVRYVDRAGKSSKRPRLAQVPVGLPM